MCCLGIEKDALLADMALIESAGEVVARIHCKVLQLRSL